MKDILDWIRDEKLAEVSRRKMELPVEAMHHALAKKPRRDVRSLSHSLRASRTGIIAEFKRKSPSKGWIAPDALVGDIVPKYEHAGASACSVLGDKHFFGGSMEDVRRARQATSHVPILYKEFLVDAYQVYEARMIGADAILLIAALLSPEDCREWAKLANSLGLEVLLEVHSLDELEYLNPHVQVLGGYEGFLIGEYFMRQVSPAETLHELIQALESDEAR